MRLNQVPDKVAHRIISVRHAEPDASGRGRCIGSTDLELSSTGRTQAQTAANALASIPLAAVYASPLRRAQETAEILSAKRTLSPVLCDGLREIDFGDFEGRKFDELQRSEPELYSEWMEKPFEFQFPGGECFSTFQKRVLHAFTKLQKQHRGETILIVAHAGTNRIHLCNVLRFPAENLFRFTQDHAAFNVVETHEDRKPVVRGINLHRLDGLAGR